MKVRTEYYNYMLFLKDIFFTETLMSIKKSASRCITQQGRQREPSVKTLRSPLSADFWRHCGGIAPRHQSEEMEI